MDTTKTTTHLGLCAGYGGIELGLKRVIPNLRSVALCEIEAFACANLVAKMEAGLMESAPLWTDLKTFPWGAFRDRVDILTGGYPCQPFSAAGKRLGTEDPRHLWPYIASGIRILRPKLCFFENVEGHISLGLREVVGELESMGYKVSWGIFSAREVGAPHQRKRVFILAVSNSLGGAAGLSRSLAWNEGIAGEFDHGSGEGCRELANACNARLPCTRSETQSSGTIFIAGNGHREAWPSRPGEPQHAWEPPRVVGGSVAHSNSNEPSEGRGDNAEVSEVSSEQWKDECATLSGGEGELSGEIMANSVIVGRRGRDHGDAGGLRGEIQTAGSCCSGAEEVVGNAAESRCERSRRQNDPRGSTHRPTQPDRSAGHGDMESEQWQAESTLGRDADGPAGWMDYAELQVSCDNRTDELRLLGNGVVPATAERAFRTLLDELNT